MSSDTNYEVLRHVLAEYGVDGWAAEFGVYSGLSLGIIAEHMPVIGFDSFEGLPEDWRPEFSAGAFSRLGEMKKGIPLDVAGPNRMVVTGWFEDTVPGFPFPKLGLVHIDCDLYSSTVTALDGVTASVGVGTILVFDEYHGYPGSEEHEEKAFQEWITKNAATVEKIAHGVEEAAFVIHDMGEM